MACEQMALLAARRGKAVAPERDVISDRSELRARGKIGLDTGAEDDEVECKAARRGFNDGDPGLFADGLPRAVAVPGKVFEAAATPEGILGRGHRKLLQDAAHEA